MMTPPASTDVSLSSGSRKAVGVGSGSRIAIVACCVGGLAAASAAPPKLSADSITISAGGQAVLDVLANDDDRGAGPLEIVEVGMAAGLGIQLQKDQTLHIDATQANPGTYRFDYVAQNGKGRTSKAQVRVTVSRIAVELQVPERIEIDWTGAVTTTRLEGLVIGSLGKETVEARVSVNTGSLELVGKIKADVQVRSNRSLWITGRSDDVNAALAALHFSTPRDFTAATLNVVVRSDRTNTVRARVPLMNDALAMQWTFENTQGGVVPDRTGNGHDLDLVGIETQGLMRGAALRAQAEGWGIARESAGLAYADGFTVTGWVFHLGTWSETGPRLPRLARTMTRPTEGGWLVGNTAMHTDAFGGIVLTNGDYAQRHETAASDAVVGRWVHYAATYDNQTLITYRNGQEVSRSSGAAAGTVLPNPGRLFVGEGMEALLDDVRIYDAPLSDVAVASVRSRGPARVNLAAYAGRDRSLSADQMAQLSGRAFTQIPLLIPSVSWTQTAGPSCTIAQPGAADTGVAFTEAGTYAFSFEATLLFGLIRVSDSVTITAHDPDALQSGLVAHWTFDEGAGSTAVDVTGNGHNGTFQGNVLREAGWVGGGIRTADGSWITVPDAADLHLQQVTISARMLLDRPFQDMTLPWPEILTKQNWWQSGGYHLGASGAAWSGEVGMRLYGTESGAWSWREETVPGPRAGVWSQVTAVYDGGSLRLYIDGRPHEPVPTGDFTTGHDGTAIAIGWGLEGVLDDIRIYGRALSDGEVEAVAVETPIVGNG